MSWAQLVDLRRRASEYATRDGRIAADEYFFAEQNARLVRNAEEYYRSMFGGHVESWNLRDTHMMETLQALLTHVRQTSGQARAVVWAHNSHLGDARATQMGQRGELNLGQLVREAFGEDARARALDDAHRHGDGGHGLGRARAAQTRASVTRRQLRAALSRCSDRSVLLVVGRASHR